MPPSAAMLTVFSERRSDLLITARDTRAEGVVSLTLADPGGAQLPAWTPGAHRAPRNPFPLHSVPRYIFLAGGIGITPILPMVAAATEAGADWRLYYGGRGQAPMAFLDELEPYGDRVAVWPQDTRGLLPLDDILEHPAEGTLVYCCGPEGLL